MTDLELMQTCCNLIKREHLKENETLEVKGEVGNGAIKYHIILNHEEMTIEEDPESAFAWINGFRNACQMISARN